MTNGLMLQIKDTLGGRHCARLGRVIEQHDGPGVRLSALRRPQLLFVSTVPKGLPPGTLVDVIRGQGFQARVVGP